MFFIFLNGILNQCLRGRKQVSVKVLMEDFGKKTSPNAFTFCCFKPIQIPLIYPNT